MRAIVSAARRVRWGIGPSDVAAHSRGPSHGYLPDDLSDVVRAEFSLGSTWGRVFDVPIRPGAQIGMRTHAYGPAVCVCRVTSADGHRAVLERLLDFEMGGVFDADA